MYRRTCVAGRDNGLEVLRAHDSPESPATNGGRLIYEGERKPYPVFSGSADSDHTASGPLRPLVHRIRGVKYVTAPQIGRINERAHAAGHNNRDGPLCPTGDNEVVEPRALEIACKPH